MQWFLQVYISLPCIWRERENEREILNEDNRRKNLNKKINKDACKAKKSNKEMIKNLLII